MAPPPSNIDREELIISKSTQIDVEHSISTTSPLQTNVEEETYVIPPSYSLARDRHIMVIYSLKRYYEANLVVNELIIIEETIIKSCSLDDESLV